MVGDASWLPEDGEVFVLSNTPTEKYHKPSPVSVGKVLLLDTMMLSGCNYENTVLSSVSPRELWRLELEEADVAVDLV